MMSNLGGAIGITALQIFLEAARSGEAGRAREGCEVFRGAVQWRVERQKVA
jgi:hypothetical protein